LQQSFLLLEGNLLAPTLSLPGEAEAAQHLVCGARISPWLQRARQKKKKGDEVLVVTAMTVFRG
jgi:hypothetical protein